MPIGLLERIAAWRTLCDDAQVRGAGAGSSMRLSATCVWKASPSRLRGRTAHA